MGTFMSNDDAKNRLLDAAGPIFADKGFQAATVREICLAAGVNLASVNYYFGDKEALYVETIHNAHRLRTEQVPHRIWPPETPPDEKLRDFIHTLISRMLAAEPDAWQPRLMLRELLQPTAACEALVEDYFRPQFGLLLSILDEILPADVPSHRRHQMGFSIVGECLFYRVAGHTARMLVPGEEWDEHFSIDQLARHIAEVSTAALGLAEPLGGNSRPLDGKRRAACREDPKTKTETENDASVARGTR